MFLGRSLKECTACTAPFDAYRNLKALGAAIQVTAIVVEGNHSKQAPHTAAAHNTLPRSYPFAPWREWKGADSEGKIGGESLERYTGGALPFLSSWSQ